MLCEWRACGYAMVPTALLQSPRRSDTFLTQLLVQPSGVSTEKPQGSTDAKLCRRLIKVEEKRRSAERLEQNYCRLT